jgi:hypothetical protein
VIFIMIKPKHILIGILNKINKITPNNVYSA